MTNVCQVGKSPQMVAAERGSVQTLQHLLEHRHGGSVRERLLAADAVRVVPLQQALTAWGEGRLAAAV